MERGARRFLMAQLPVFQTTLQPLMLMQNKWASIINPTLASPLSQPSMLTDISIVSGNNVIYHKLGQLPVGWIISDVNASVSIYRNAPFNTSTLTLHSNGAAVISLIVF